MSKWVEKEYECSIFQCTDHAIVIQWTSCTSQIGDLSRGGEENKTEDEESFYLSHGSVLTFD